MSADPTDPIGTPLLAMTGIVKQFPGVRALDGVDLDVVSGEVHCLLGQNGAGKSTLIKVLSGAHHPDEGTIHWNGELVKLATPMAAMRLGIATIYQELDLVNDLTVAENITLGHEPSRLGFAERRTERNSAAALLKRLGHPEISPSAVVGTLPAAGKQIVSMARALSRDVKLMIMDEPSAVLDQGEVARLFEVIRDLTANGVAVIYISHRLEEIRAIGDRVTVLKDGRTVATGLPAKTTPTADVIRLMTGRTIEYVFPPRSGQTFTGAPLLDVSGISRRREFEDVTFTVHPGEVVGLAGLVGSGRSEILETVYGARGFESGSVSVDGKPLRCRLRSCGGRRRRRPVPGGAQGPGPAARPDGRQQRHAAPPCVDSPSARSSAVARRRRQPPRRSGAWTCAPRIRSETCAPSRAGISRRSSSRGGCSRAAGCSCSTSRREVSTSARGASCTPSSAGWPTPGWPCSLSAARCPRSSACPTGCWCA